MRSPSVTAVLWSHVVPFVLHSIALLWPNEWEVISRLFIVDQPISIHCFKQITPSGPTTQYTTQPGETVVHSKLKYCCGFFRVLTDLMFFFSRAQICVGSAERASSSSSRGTSESTPRQPSTSAKSSKTRGYDTKGVLH